jgi:hypothetical protein
VPSAAADRGGGDKPFRGPTVSDAIEVAPGHVSVVSRSLDDRQWVVSYVLDASPVRSYLYDRDTGEARFLFSNRPACR